LADHFASVCFYNDFRLADREAGLERVAVLQHHGPQLIPQMDADDGGQRASPLHRQPAAPACRSLRR
jgi:hypothetical protein